MPSYLICSTPVHGHVSPMLTIAAELVRRGHRVTVLTGTRFEQRVRETGADFAPLRGAADFDDREVESYLPDRDRYRGIAQAQYDIQTIFVRPIPDQHAAVAELLAEQHYDAVLVDAAFAGVLPLLTSAGNRPPVLAIGVTPLTQLSSDAAPSGMGLAPSASPLGRLRNRTLNLLARRVFFRDTQVLAQCMMAELGAPPLRGFAMDFSRDFDRFLQLGPASLEYPRRDISPNIAFVGVPRSAPGKGPLPGWWAELDGSRPLVHVTQGTIDNRDLDRLIRPTIEALADRDVTVVVSMGGRDPDDLGTVPANVRVSSYLDYERLLPVTDVMITNGGFGGVLNALSHGVPLIVAGDTEDKPEVAARVSWSGAGVNLRTGTPSSAAVGDAVTKVLADPGYREAAQRLRAQTAGYTTFDLVEHELASAAVRPAGVQRG